MAVTSEGGGGRQRCAHTQRAEKKDAAHTQRGPTLGRAPRGTRRGPEGATVWPRARAPEMVKLTGSACGTVVARGCRGGNGRPLISREVSVKREQAPRQPHTDVWRAGGPRVTRKIT